MDEGGIVEVKHDDADFMSGPHDVVRYHASGITVSRMRDTEDAVSIVHIHALEFGDTFWKKRTPEIVYQRDTVWRSIVVWSPGSTWDALDTEPSLTRPCSTWLWLGSASKCDKRLEE